MDFVESIDVIDIDQRVFPVAEEFFLQQPLDKKLNPITQSARGWIYDMIQQGKQYDMIIVDAYNGTSLPDELVTQEFFAGLDQLSDKVMINLITDKALTSDFSRHFLATVESVFDKILWRNASSTPRNFPIGNLVFATFDTPDMEQAPNVD